MTLVPVVVSVGTVPVNVLAGTTRSGVANNELVHLSAPAAGNGFIVPKGAAGTALGHPIPAAGIDVALPDDHELWVAGSATSTVTVLVPNSRLKTQDPQFDKPPAGLKSLEVWFDHKFGLTQRGRQSRVVLRAEGTVTQNANGSFDINADAVSAVTVDGYIGELTVDPSLPFGTAGNEIIRGFQIMNLGTITAGAAARRVWSNKVATAAAAAGMQIDEPLANEFTPRLQVADGVVAVETAAHATNIESIGLCMVYWELVAVGGIPTARLNVVTSAGRQTAVTANITAVSAFEIPQDGIVFGAGCDSATTGAGGGPGAVDGVTGSANNDIYAGGWDRSQNVAWADDLVDAIAAYYGVT